MRTLLTWSLGLASPILLVFGLCHGCNYLAKWNRDVAVPPEMYDRANKALKKQVEETRQMDLPEWYKGVDD